MNCPYGYGIEGKRKSNGGEISNMKANRWVIALSALVIIFLPVLLQQEHGDDRQGDGQ
jgi:hypothetical protein